MRAFSLLGICKLVVGKVSTIRGLQKLSVISGLLTVLLLGLSSPANASVTYNINMSGDFLGNGAESLTGTITTDGATGTLQPADITGFYLSASGPVSLIVDSTINGVFQCQPNGCNLHVIGNQLIAGAQGITGNSDPEISFYDGIPLPPFQANISIVSGPSSEGGIISQVLVFASNGSPSLAANVGSTLVVGNAITTVPLPGAAYLLVSGMASLVGFVRRKAG